MPRYDHIAVASALSPRFRAVLAEGWRFATRFGAKFSIIHADGYSAEREEQFREANEALGIPLSTQIIWKEGPPALSIVNAAREQGVDLLVAGALERDSQMHFLGGVARELMRRLHCSLLLLTHPEVEEHTFRRLVTITDYTEEAREAFQSALKLGEMDESEVLYVLSVFSPFAKARASLGENSGAEGRHEDQEEALLQEFVSPGEHSPLTIDPRVIHTTTGMGASDFTKNVDADLLIVPASAHPEEGTLLPTYLDWVFKVIPCNLWVVKQSSRP
jgi:nucleotide-binding universal stress UspA family protein